MEDIAKTLSAYIAKDILKKPNRVIREDESILRSGLIDSFHLVDLGLFVEDTFGVRIEDFELNADTFDSVQELVALIQKRR